MGGNQRGQCEIVPVRAMRDVPPGDQYTGRKGNQESGLGSLNETHNKIISHICI